MIDRRDLERALAAEGVRLEITPRETAGVRLMRPQRDVRRLRVHPSWFDDPEASPLLIAYCRREGGTIDRDLELLRQRIRHRIQTVENHRDQLAQRLDGLRIIVRVNDNRRTFLSLRYRRGHGGGLTLSIHRGLLSDPHLLDDLERFARDRGRGTYPLLRAAMYQLYQRLGDGSAPLAHDPALDNLEPVGAAVDLHAEVEAVRQRYFADLTHPVTWCRWGRDPGAKHLRTIRFGSYRCEREPMIIIHPRLRRPWVARIFLQHVIHHEYCHHYQACYPLLGEAYHSSRFKQLEQTFDGYQLARRWERQALPRLLAPETQAPST